MSRAIWWCARARHRSRRNVPSTDQHRWQRVDRPSRPSDQACSCGACDPPPLGPGRCRAEPPGRRSRAATWSARKAVRRARKADAARVRSCSDPICDPKAGACRMSFSRMSRPWAGTISGSMRLQEPGSSVHCAMCATETLPEGCLPEGYSCFVQDTEVYCTDLARSSLAWLLQSWRIRRVIITRGAMPCSFSKFRNKHLAALALRQLRLGYRAQPRADRWRARANASCQRY